LVSTADHQRPDLLVGTDLLVEIAKLGVPVLMSMSGAFPDLHGA
jgi:hypothetical protein